MGEVKKIQPAKVEAIAELKEKFSAFQEFFFTDYRGLSVEQITNLRTKLREESTEYKVVKNNFAKIAFEQLGVKGVENLLVGPTALTLVGGEANAVAKILVEFAKDAPVEVKGAFVAGSVFGAEDVVALSKLPGRLELIQMLMGTMNAPMQNFVYALNGVTTKLVRTLQAVADSKSA